MKTEQVVNEHLENKNELNDQSSASFLLEMNRKIDYYQHYWENETLDSHSIQDGNQSYLKGFLSNLNHLEQSIYLNPEDNQEQPSTLPPGINNNN